jgi:hypothetical protein
MLPVTVYAPVDGSPDGEVEGDPEDGAPLGGRVGANDIVGVAPGVTVRTAD